MYWPERDGSDWSPPRTWERRLCVLAAAVLLAGCSDRAFGEGGDETGEHGSGNDPGDWDPGDDDETGAPGDDETGDGELEEVPARIVFDSERGEEEYDYSSAIYSIGIDGTDLRTLASSDLLGDSKADFTADGMRMVHNSHRDSSDDGGIEIYLMDFVAGTDVNLTRRIGIDSNAQWSPDETRIAFDAEPEGDWHIYVMDADGSNLVQISDHWGDRYAQWSPDGELIMFSRQVNGGDYDVMTVRPDGTGLVNLTNHPSADDGGTWSPDGKRIAFYSEREDLVEDRWGHIYTMNRDGSDIERLTYGPGWSWGPRWSPDGSQIAYTREVDRESDMEIWVIDADGSNDRPLTDGPGWAGHIAWSPDGEYIAFGANRSDNVDVYVMRRDGSEQRQLTTHPANDLNITWRPRHWE